MALQDLEARKPPHPAIYTFVKVETPSRRREQITVLKSVTSKSKQFIRHIEINDVCGIKTEGMP
jgi:hypothetical protein